MRNGWVVPPLRRLSSIAYGVHSPLVAADHDEVDREPAQRALVGQPPPDRLGVLGDRPGVLRRRRERAAQVALPARAAEQLVVRRQQLDRAAGQDPQLDAGAADLLAGDPLLDDPRALLELGEVDLERRRRRLQLHAPQPVQDGGPLVRGPGCGQTRQPHDRVALPGDALVELDDGAVHRGPLGPHPDHGVDHVVEGAQVLHTQRMRDADLGEHPAAAGLGAERREPRIGAVHRDPEAQRDVALELGGVVGHQVRALPVRDQRGDPRQEMRPLQELLAQRARGRVVHRDQRQAGSRMAGDHSGEQREVVLDDLRGDRQRGDVDHPQPGLAQQHEQEQEPLLERLGHAPARRHGPVEGDRGDRRPPTRRRG